MILVDTSIWIEFLKGKQPFYETLSILIADRQVLTAACIFAELLQGARNAREEKIILSFWQELPKVSDSQFANIWIKAGRVSAKERWYSKGVGLIDAAILLLSQENKAKIWSLDKAMKGMAKKYDLNFEM